MTRQELKVAEILRRNFHFVEGFAWEGPTVDINKVACDMVRELAADAAFDLLTGADQPTIKINPASFQRFNRCNCPDPVERCDDKGCRCTLCGYPT